VKPKLFLYIAGTIGLLSTLISVIYGNEATKFVKPFVHIFLFFFFVSNKSFDFKVLLFLIFAGIAEYLTATGFEANYYWLLLFFSLYFLMGIIVLLPYFRVKILKASKLEWITGSAAALLIATIIIWLSIETSYLMEDEYYILLPMFIYLLFLFALFYLFSMLFHPKKIALFITGACYVIVCSGAVIYELFYNIRILLGIVNLTEVIAQISLIYFLSLPHKPVQISNSLD
jgi:hypothetical protein